MCNNEFVKRLIEKRNLKGLTREQMSAKTGIEINRYYQLESGNINNFHIDELKL